MEAPEVPLEAAQEHIHHAAHGGHDENSGQKKWILGVALSSAIFAALAAVASLMAGHHINEALISQLEASDQWALYQAKGIKSGVLNSKIDLLKAMEKTVDPKDVDKAKEYITDQKKIKDAAENFERERTHHIEHHENLAVSVTMIQVCIAVAAIAVLTNRKWFWWLGLIFGAVGIFFIAKGLLPESGEAHHETTENAAAEAPHEKKGGQGGEAAHEKKEGAPSEAPAEKKEGSSSNARTLPYRFVVSFPASASAVVRAG